MKRVAQGVLLSFLLLGGAPSFSQDFDLLLNQLTGSEADQKDSEGNSSLQSPSSENTIGESSSFGGGEPGGREPQGEGAEGEADSQKVDLLPPVPTGPLPPSSLDIAASVEEDSAPPPPSNVQMNGVVLQGLDKTTARVFITKALIGQEIEFGTLKITVHRCEKAPPEARQDSMAFVTIAETKPNCPTQELFSGWMFASSPSLSALDHPLYDVWIKECKNIKRSRSR